MNRKIVFTEGEYYHIYNRGVEKREIFLSAEDYRRFHRLLFFANGVKPVVYKRVQGLTSDRAQEDEFCSIGAYVLMPNHFHLLVRARDDVGITEFMRKITTGYTMYFNKKNERTGHLFEGAFKAEHVDRDEYLKYLFAYIHLNPVKLIDSSWKENGIGDPVRAKKYLENFTHSSYLDWMGSSREERNILSVGEFPEYFGNAEEFDVYINDWLTVQGLTLDKETEKI